MSSKIIAWVSSKGKDLLKKSTRNPKSSKSWTKKIISKLPFQRKLNAKNEWKKENQSTMDTHDTQTEKACAVDSNNNASKESCARHRSILMTACHSGDTEKVKSLLEEDVDINEQDEEGTTALILACLGGHTEVVEMLLKKGAHVETQKTDGNTALMCSSEVKVVELLLEHGAKVSLQDKEKWTALMRAADNGLTEVVQLLLEHHAQVDAQSEWRQTALMLASRKGHVEVVQLLLEHKAEVDLQDYQGWTALMLASRSSHIEVVKFLLKHSAAVDLHTDAGTALMWASEEGHEDVVKLFLEHGAQVNLHTKVGETALMRACDAGHSKVAKLLLEYSALVDMYTKQSWETALLRASKKGYDEVVKLLLEHYAQVDLHSRSGETPLMCASMEGHYEVAAMLLEHDAQVDFPNSEGETALMLASSRGHHEVVKLLVEHGAQVYMKDNYEFSILMHACRQGNADVVKVLLSKGCDIQINEPNSRGETALMYASQGEVAKVLLDHGALFDLQNIDGRTALMLAASSGHIEVVESLLEHGAQVTVQDKYGSSVLMHACSQRQCDIVQMLLRRGCAAQIHQPDNFGKTALMCASAKGHNEVAEVLLEHGAQVDFQDRKGHTALIHASREGRCEVVKFLLKHGAQVDFQDKKGKTALIHASRKGCIQVAKLLLEHHAQIDLKVKKKLTECDCSIECEQTALMMAQEPEVAEFFLEHGAQVNLCVNLAFSDNGSLAFSEHGTEIHLQIQGKAEGVTALMLSPIFQNHETFMTLLLEHDAKVDLEAKVITFIAKHHSYNASGSFTQADETIKGEIEGITALMCAAAHQWCEGKVAALLLQHGAQVDLQTTGEVEGVTALMFAAISGNEEVAYVLLEHGAQVDLQAKGNIHFAVFFAHIVERDHFREGIKLLLEHGALGDLCTKHEVEGFTALMCAVVFGSDDVTRLLLEHGAQVNIQANGVMKGKTALILALVTKHYKDAELLLKHGADVNLRDDDGWSPLMYAVQAENLKVIELLITHGANIHVKTNTGNTLHDICPLNLKEDPKYIEALLRTDKNLELNSKHFPGIIFFGQPLRETLTRREATIGELCDGLSVCVPTNALSFEEEPAKLSIRPCFNGPFEFPAEYKPVSPAYLIRHSKTRFQKDITIRMHHYANLQSEKDCEDMAFLTASSTPEYRGEQPVYVFKEIPGARGMFKPGDQVGEISLQHFCLLITGKRKRENDSEDSSESPGSASKRHQGGFYYSARLYRGAEHEGTVSAAVFCMCLYHPIYIKHCDVTIAKSYTGGKSADYVQVHGESIVIDSNDPSREHVKFDKVPAQILTRDVHLPEIMNIDVGELLEYPPRLLISVKTSQGFTSPVLQVHGLDKECGYSLLPVSTPFITPQVGSFSSTAQLARETTPVTLQPPENQFTEKLCSLQQSFQQNVVSSSAARQISPRALNCSASAPLQSPANQVAEGGYEPSSIPLPQKGNSMPATDNKVLDIDDLSDVLDEVEPLSSKWRILLTKLGAKQSTLDSIETNNMRDVNMCLYASLGEWLKLNYDHHRHEKPSWRRLVKAVSSIDFALSETIAEKHTVK